MTPPAVSRIRMPWARRMQNAVRSLLPIGVWSLAIVMFAFMAQRHMNRQVLLEGLVENREAVVTALQDGMLTKVSVRLHDTVEAGQIVAELDDSAQRAALGEASAELEKLRAQVAAEHLGALTQQADLKTEERRFHGDMERTRLEVATRKASQESDKITLSRLQDLAKRQQSERNSGLLSEQAYVQTQLEHDALQMKIKENAAAIAEAETNAKDAQQRWMDYVGQMASIQGDLTLKPLLAAITALESQVQALTALCDQLKLRAPIRGQITLLSAMEGQPVARGVPILSISDTQARRALAYANERAPMPLKTGDTVEVYSAAAPQTITKARVASLSSSVETLPAQLTFPPNLPRWGRGILIDGLPAGVFTPGERVYVRPASGG